MKRVLKIGGILAVILLLILIALPFLIDANQFRPMMQARLTQALGRDVKVGNLKLALLSGGVTADDLAIADDPAFSKTPFLQAKSLAVSIDLPGLIFSRKLTVTGLTIDQPQISLLQAPSGEWNYSSMGTKSAARPEPAAAPSASGSKLDLSVKLVKITSGRLTIGHTGSRLKPLVLEKVAAELHDFSAASEFPFSLSMNVAGGGTIKLDGKAGPLDQTDIALTPAAVSLKIDRLDLAGSGVNEMAPNIAGLVSFDGSGQIKGTAADIKGKLKIENVKLSTHGTPAKPVLGLDFHVTHDTRKRAGTVHQGDIHIGSAVAHLTGAYAVEADSMAIKMQLAGPVMPIQELSAMLPAMGIVLPMGSSLQGGTADVKASMEGPVDRLVTVASVSFNKTKLAGFNLPSKLSTIERLAGIKSTPDTEIDVLSSDVRSAPDGATVENLKLVLPAIGDLAGGGTVSPEYALNFKMQASVHTSGMAAVLNNQPVPFTVDGTCAQPAFHPDIKAVVKNEVKSVGKELLKGLFGK